MVTNLVTYSSATCFVATRGVSATSYCIDVWVSRAWALPLKSLWVDARMESNQPHVVLCVRRGPTGVLMSRLLKLSIKLGLWSPGWCLSYECNMMLEATNSATPLREPTKHLIKSFHFPFALCFIYNLFFIHIVPSLQGNHSWSFLFTRTLNSYRTFIYSTHLFRQTGQFTIGQMTVHHHTFPPQSISWKLTCILSISPRLTSLPASLLVISFSLFLFEVCPVGVLC